MFGLGLDVWNGILVSCLAVTVLATTAVWLLQKQENIEATERADRLENETEKLRHANLLLEERISPRRLSFGQQAAMVEALSGFRDGPHVVRITSYALDTEGLGLAKQISAILESAHIKHADHFSSVAAMDDNLVIGINVRGSFRPLTEAIADFLGSIDGLSITRLEDEVPGAALRSAPILPDAAIAAFIFVGAKPVATIK